MPTQELDPTSAKILDGAVRVLSEFGVKRATVELVAKYAGVSHMTIYRRWPAKNDLLRAATISELTSLLDTAFTQPGESFGDRVLAAFAEVVCELRDHPLLQREVSTESGDQSPVLAGPAVMETCVPLVTERLRELGPAAGAGPQLDSTADLFVRLAHSLVVLKRPSRPMTTRTEVAAYAAESLGPHLSGLSRPAAEPDPAPVIELDQRRRTRTRPHLQIAAASLVGVLTLGAGLTAVLNGNIKVPFIAPAGISQSTIPSAPPPAPGYGGSPASAVSPVSDVPVSAPEPLFPAPADQPSAVTPLFVPPAAAAAIPQAPPSIISGGSVGGGAADVNANAAPGPRPAPAPAPAPSPKPTPAPQPPAPKPPAPGPQPPGPQPPGPQPPGPQPPGPGPAPAPKPPPPAKPAGPGPGPQANKQAGPSN